MGRPDPGPKYLAGEEPGPTGRGAVVGLDAMGPDGRYTTPGAGGRGSPGPDPDGLMAPVTTGLKIKG